MWNKVSVIFTIFMIIIYLGAGIFILTAEDIMTNFPPYIRYLFGGTILIYALYRIVVLYSKIKAQRNDERNEE